MNNKEKVQIIVANPAGNITIFVKTQVGRQRYQEIAGKLLAIEELKGEQVSFILETGEWGRAEGKMEMCGLEFCGNASRSFGLMTAKAMGISGKGKVNVDVSGCNSILTVEVDTTTNYTKIKMPDPVGYETLDLSQIGVNGSETEVKGLKNAETIDFGGIIHVVLKDVPASKETFDVIKDYINQRYNPPAMGVMFYDTHKGRLVPVVYVKDVDTTYFEGSCGSGTTACGAAFSMGREDGSYTYTLPQPAGTIDTTAIVEGGRIKEVYIEGPVDLSPVMEVEI